MADEREADGVDRDGIATRDDRTDSTAHTRDTTPSAAGLPDSATDFGLAGGDPARDPLVGSELGDLRIERVIGEGGMGRVYEAGQRGLARSVAVKVMRTGIGGSAAASLRFRREAEVLGRLRHPGIAHVYTAGMHRAAGGDTPYIVMEFVPGAAPLVEYASRHGLDVRARLQLLRQVCEAVAHGHRHGIVHRDLKPGNILVDEDGHPKVIDFGIARITDDLAPNDSVTETGQFVGTRPYMSPEQFLGEPVDARSDVYSLGVILHELLTGRLPHDLRAASLVDTARLVCEEPPRELIVPERGFRRGIAAIAARCLEKKPGDRYPDAADLAADLDRVLGGLPVRARAPRLDERVGRWLRRRRTPLAALGAAAVAAAVVGVASSARRVTSPGAWQPSRVAAPDAIDTEGPAARFDGVSSGRTTPVDRVGLHFSEPVSGLSVADLRLSRDGRPVPTTGLTIRQVGEATTYEVKGLRRLNAEQGSYELSLVGTADSPVDASGNRLDTPASVTWRMPAFREVAFNLLDDRWRSSVVSMDDVEFFTERSAGAARFIRPTVPGKEGSIVLRFDYPFTIHAATLLAGMHVWTTGDPFPYDPESRAAIDVSPDGVIWKTVASLEPGRGGEVHGPHDIGETVEGGTTIWVRARLTGSREWPGDGLIFSQFLRTDPEKPELDTFVLTATGDHPPVIPEADDP